MSVHNKSAGLGVFATLLQEATVGQSEGSVSNPQSLIYE